MATRKTVPKPAPAATAAKGGTKAKGGIKKAAGRVQRRFWLTYPPQRIKAPVIWELGHKFPIVTNIRQASVNDEVGIVCLEIDGAAADVEAGVQWLKKAGVSVEPVELNAVES